MCKTNQRKTCVMIEQREKMRSRGLMNKPTEKEECGDVKMAGQPRPCGEGGKGSDEIAKSGTARPG